jgi:branched-chain amino acid transport system substrate-binding protein
MNMARSAGLILSGLMSAAAWCGTASAAIPDRGVTIGVLTDLSGVYSDLTGMGSIEAAKMAVEDFGGTVGGKPIQVLAADAQNKPDISGSIARKWVDVDHVDTIVDVPNTAVALAALAVTAPAHKILLNTGGGSTIFTNKACTPLSFHWVYDTYATAHNTTASVVADGAKTWYYVTADYTFGYSLEKDSSDVVVAAGGKVLGDARAPLGTSDFSSYLLQAQSSGAQIIGLANAGGDFINVVKQAHEFGIGTGVPRLAALATFITDIKSLGLDNAKGLLLTTGFYWDLDDSTRAWSARWAARMKQDRKPTMLQAAVYSAVLHYLKAVKAADTTDGDVVAATMRTLPIDDFFMHNASILPNGRVIHDMYLAQVKTPEESHAAWDFYKILKVIPAADAFQPLSVSECPLIRN